MKNVLFLLLFTQLCFGQMVTQSLNNNWNFKHIDSTKVMPAVVPGSVQWSLLKQGKIEHPFYRTNERTVQWIENQDWEYSQSFVVDSAVFNSKVVNLVFYGLSTYASVYLNNTKVLSSSNAFVTYEINVKPLLNAQQNQLRIVFYSPNKIAAPLAAKLPYKLPASNDPNPNKLSVFTRQAPFQFGWDWAPRLVNIGISKAVELQAYNHFKVHNTYYKPISITDSQADYEAQFTIYAADNEQVELNLNFAETDSVETGTWVGFLLKGCNVVKFNFTIYNPKRWWCNQLGDPYLYKPVLNFTNTNRNVLLAHPTVLGVRTLKLIQKPDGIGQSFYFELNGKPIFAKGASVIPGNSFSSQYDATQQAQLIDNALAANFNMIRIWGGGEYPSEDFYGLCDEKGILIWQDFMFACAMYPGDNDFFNNVKTEIEQQILAFRSHPSLALWCGNNENYQAWFNWGWQKEYNLKPSDSVQIFRAYQRLFEAIIPEELRSNDTQTPYICTTPLSNAGKISNFAQGDIHYWGVWHEEKPFSAYKTYVGRFMSEYGFQSFPSLYCIQKYALPSECNLESEVMQWHQKSYKGNRLISEMLATEYKPYERFDEFVYLSQLLQAQGVTIAIDAHRFTQTNLLNKCMGTIYWQLNDCWPGPSWSSIDFYGKWKALHYKMKDSYAPLLLGMENKQNSLEFSLSNTSVNDVSGNIILDCINFNGDTILSQVKIASCKAMVSKQAMTIDKASLLRVSRAESMVLAVRFKTASGQLTSRNFYMTSAKDLNLYPVNLIMQWQQIGELAVLTLSSDVLVKDLFLDQTLSESNFSENFFDLVPGERKRLTIKGDAEALKANLKYYCLNQFQ